MALFALKPTAGGKGIILFQSPESLNVVYYANDIAQCYNIKHYC